jgi:hypothetical protein
MHMFRLPLAVLPLVLLTAPAGAGDGAGGSASERFSFQPGEGGGYLRLDRTTGAVSFCSAKEAFAVCRLGADERATLEAEIARLREENARLKASQAPSALPGEEEFERALSFTERFLRRIMRLFKEEAPTNDRL